MFNFSKQVEGFLTTAGWHTGRKIDTDALIKHLEQKGCIVSAVIESFLKEFGQLKIDFLLPNGNIDHLHFDAIKAVNDINPIWVEEYSKRLKNESLCVIGQAYSNHLTLLINYSGQIYGGYDDNLYFIGESGEEAIQAICLNYKLTEVP